MPHLSLRRCRTAAILALSLLGYGCTPPNLTQSLGDSANELNRATRFGRMDVALELVGAKARDDFAKRHADWGRGTRIVDVELAGMTMVEKEAADVFLTVQWQPIDQSEVRTTFLAQRWTHTDGSWLLAEEERRSGDGGLFGEAIPSPPSTAPRAPAQFPTLTIPADDSLGR